MSLIAELKRRNVFRVALAYLALAWLTIEAASILLPGFGVPDWAFRFVVIILALGFVPALIFSWAYEVTPEGLKREQDVVREHSRTQETGRRLDLLTIGLVVVALVVVVTDRFLVIPEALQESTNSEEPATTQAETPIAESDGSIDSIAVLPFANRSANPDDVFFVDGIHDDLLTHISEINSLKTISRTSVMQYRGSTLSVPDIAEELGVAVILEGGVQRAGDQVRINVQLIDARTDDHLWAEIYDRELTASNIFSIQSEIAQSIAGALRATLTPTDRARIDKIPTENLDALEAYFLGRQSMVTRRILDLKEAAEYLKSAIALDPGFALAYASLADTYLLLGGYGGMKMVDALPQSAAAADQALALDPELGAAHASVAKRLGIQGDVEGAKASFRRAIELSPNYAPAYQWYAQFLQNLDGQIDEALRLSKRAIELDPKSAIVLADHAEALERAGRPRDAAAFLLDSIELEPRLATGYKSLARIYAFHLGQLDQALPQYQRAAQLEPENLNSVRLSGLIFIQLGDWEQAEAQHARLREPEDLPPDFVIAMETRSGNTEAALAAARSDIESPPVFTTSLRFLRDAAIASGDFDTALKLFRDVHPELFNVDSLEVSWRNREAAVELAYLLLQMDEQEHAERLLEQSEAAIAWGRQLWTTEAYAVLQARIDALRGDTPAALSSLRKAADQGWRMHARYFLEQDPVLADLRDEPEFQRIKADIESDMAEQLARVREQNRLD